MSRKKRKIEKEHYLPGTTGRPFWRDAQSLRTIGIVNDVRSLSKWLTGVEIACSPVCSRCGP